MKKFCGASFIRAAVLLLSHKYCEKFTKISECKISIGDKGVVLKEYELNHFKLQSSRRTLKHCGT
jgi:hypothetical protein